MVLLNVVVLPVDISDLIENELETLCIKCDIMQETDEDSVDSKEVICEVPNIENFAAITHLNLSRCHLEEFPDSLEAFNNLLVFNISFNCFQKVPSCLENNMPVLKKMDLSHNRIETFDFVPACVRTLKELNVANTAIQAFPKWLNKAINLVKIDMSNNSLSKEEDRCIENILISVKSLNISNCNFTYDDLNLLENFPSLECLDFGAKYSSERIQFLPVDILQKLPKLQTLHMGHSELPYINDISILDNLTVIDFRSNRLKYLPDEFALLKNLKDCKLSSNLIRTLPKNFSQLRRLEKLHLDSNLMRVLPETVSELPSLILLDIHDNLLNNVPAFYKKLLYFDVSRNDVDEPDCEIYSKIKNDLRKLYDYQLRINTRIPEAQVQYLLNDSSDESECDSLPEEAEPPEIVEENWDSDDEWEPCRNNVWNWSKNNGMKGQREHQYTFSAIPGQFED